MKKKPQTNEKVQKLKNEFYEIVKQLNNIDNTFNNVDDPKLIEACIYERNALALRADQIVKLVASYEEVSI